MRRIVLLSLIFGAIGIVGIGWYSYSVTAQPNSLSDVAIFTEPIYPQATVSNGRLTDVDGQTITVFAKSEQSETIDRSGQVPKSKFEEGRASIELGHGFSLKGDQIISATITNIGKEPFYVINLLIVGGTGDGIMPLSTLVVDPSYTPESFGDIPKPTMTEPVLLNSGQAYTGYISGNWDVRGKSIDSFGAGAVFEYDIQNKGFAADNNWSMTIEPTKNQ
ncbi:MAG: hypothetical protein ACREAK_08835 [Nitrosarchaeum sp.]